MAEDVYADRVFRFDATRRTIYSALTFDPDRAAGRPDWLELVPGELRPRVLRTVPETLVVWSSLWPVSPRDTIHFDLTDDDRHRTTAVRVRWFSDSPPDERGIAFTRYRINRKIGSGLRAWVDSICSPIIAEIWRDEQQ